MSDPIKDYKDAVLCLNEFIAWRSLIGKTYNGGWGGIGRIKEASCSMTIYHQTYDGSINYHESEKKLAPLFEKAAIQCQKEILNNVQSQLEQLVEEARKKAESLAREILKMEGEA